MKKGFSKQQGCAIIKLYAHRKERILVLHHISDYLLVSDLDGTLLQDPYTVNPRSEQAIRRLLSKGGRFTIATGRVYGAAKEILKQIPVNAPVITANGGCILETETGEVLQDLYLPEKAKSYIKEINSRFPQLDLDFFPEGAECVYVFRGKNDWENVFIGAGLSFSYAVAQDWQRRWRKCIFECPIEQKADFDEYLAEYSASFEGVCFVNSSLQFYEMIPSQVSKGSALKQLAGLLNIPRERIAAVGDFDNDLSMVRFAGIGAFTADAAPNLKKEADLVVCSNSEGAVADVVEYLEKLCGE